IHNSNVVVGMAIFYAGTMQTLAGVWEFFVGNCCIIVAFDSNKEQIALPI
ncbi:hypothetical protein MGE_05328, partial [Candida albicans P75010]